MSQGLQLVKRYCSLIEASNRTWLTEFDLFQFGIEGELNFYVRPGNWERRRDDNPLTSHPINDLVFIDDTSLLQKLSNGVECIMYFCEQYPDCDLEDQGVPEYAEFVDDYELTDNQLDRIRSGKKVRVQRDVVENNLGVTITKDRLVIKSDDLAPFLKEPQATGDDAGSASVKVKPSRQNGEQDKLRKSQLFIFIWRVHQFLNETRRPTAQEVWAEIQHRHINHDTDKIIQDVDGERILWCSGYGNEQKQTRKVFNKTLSNIRKAPPF